ncbi:MAG: SUMF1/EgtB/PvdO family nonheme iron enzyme [Treponema sp.]|jgi:formylglycine-generating enzyme required for sulfatase activity/TolB-like protein|nr:SUMF1/EgtB/PvdO family nonheme iron enzyme [Treponema sp.]
MRVLEKMMALFLLIFLTGGIFAQIKPRLGVLPFTGGENGEGETIATVFSYDSELSRAFSVIPRISSIETVMREPQFYQSTGLTDADAIARLGRPFNVDYVVAGHIRALGNDKVLLLTVIQVRKLRQIGGDYRKYRSIKDLQAMIPEIAKKFSSADWVTTFSDPPSLAILPITAPDTVDIGEIELMGQILATEIANSGNFSVIPRNRIVRSIMAEQRIKVSGITDPENIKKISRAMNARYVLSGDIQLLNDAKLFISSILDGRDAHLVTGRTVNYGATNDSIRLIQALGLSLSIVQANSAPSVFTDIPSAAPVIPMPRFRRSPNIPGAAAVPPARITPGPSPMVLVEGGVYNMGNLYSSQESPIHVVMIDRFYMGISEVTQQEWAEIMDKNPSRFKGAYLPVESISWYDAVEYCNKRSLKEGLTPAYREEGDTMACDFSASGYRLPTEAEWEYAARKGDKNPPIVYSGGTDGNDIGWFSMNSGGQSKPVQTKRPNSLGLYDMSGNVSEWCWDWYEGYKNDIQENPTGPSSGSLRVIRGGDWISDEIQLRSTSRRGEFPLRPNTYVGFRVVRSGSK